jgi:hypothetical protein
MIIGGKVRNAALVGNSKFNFIKDSPGRKTLIQMQEHLQLAVVKIG